MILRLIGALALIWPVVGVIQGNYVPLAIVAIVLIGSLPLLTRLGYHPQRNTIRGWDRG